MKSTQLGLLLLLAASGCSGQADVPVTASAAPASSTDRQSDVREGLTPTALSEPTAETAGTVREPDLQEPLSIDLPREPLDMPEPQPQPVSQSGDKVVRTEAEWKELLSSEQYHVLRQKGTERPFVNEFDHHFEPGTYSCAGCGLELFSSETKFNSGCGWPAFYAAQAGDRVKLTADYSHGMIRTEVTCARCDSHLGHIFDDAPQTPTGQRYCINSVALTFTPAEEAIPTRPDDWAQ